MMRIFQSLGNTITIVNGSASYSDTYGNYKKDGGSGVTEEVMYMEDNKVFTIKGVYQEYEKSEKYGLLIDECSKLVANKIMRETVVVEPTLDELKESKIHQAGQLFATIRDAIRWVECSTGKHGFDCATEDIVNFMSAYTPMLITGTGNVMYKVWLDSTNKGLVELTVSDMTNVYNAVRNGQLEAYVWYETIKAQINACETTEELDVIKVEG